MSGDQRLQDARILGGVVPATPDERMAAAQRSGSLQKVIGVMFAAEGVNRPRPAEAESVDPPSPREARIARFRALSKAQRDELFDELMQAEYPPIDDEPEAA